MGRNIIHPLYRPDHPIVVTTGFSLPKAEEIVQVERIDISKNKDVKGTDGVFHAEIKCYRCGAEGHYAPECPDVSNITNLQHFILSQSNTFLALLKTWIIIDTGSTLYSFCNRRLLSGLKGCNGIRAISNGGAIK